VQKINVLCGSADISRRHRRYGDEVAASQGLAARSIRGGAPFAGATPSSGPACQLPAIVRVETGKPPRNARRADIYRPRIVGAAQRRDASSGAGKEVSRTVVVHRSEARRGS